MPLKKKQLSYCNFTSLKNVKFSFIYSQIYLVITVISSQRDNEVVCMKIKNINLFFAFGFFLILSLSITPLNIYPYEDKRPEPSRSNRMEYRKLLLEYNGSN